MKKILIVISAFIGTVIMANAQHPVSIVGKWRGSLIGFNNALIPFNFEFVATKKDTTLYFINGKELYYGGKLIRKNDSIMVAINQFDTELALSVQKNSTLLGFWRKQNGAGAPTAIEASKENISRFKSTQIQPTNNISGKYDVIFTNDTGKQTKAVGLFEQNGSQIGLTFLRASGDSRFSEGIINGNQLFSSVFIGYSPLLFTGIINADGSIAGEQIGLKSKLNFVAVKNKDAQLSNTTKANSLTKDNQPFNFSFRNIQGKLVSLSDARYKNKAVIVTIGGTWCPNCADEAMFLTNWFKKNQQRGIEIITIQFEAVNDFAYAQQQMKRFKQRFNIPYEQVFGGLANNDSVLEALPSLAEFKAFPTTLFLNKKGALVKINSGFAGPATGKFHTDLIKEFNEIVDELLQ